MVIGCVMGQASGSTKAESHKKISYCGFKVGLGSPVMFTETSDCDSALVGGFVKSFYTINSMLAMSYYRAGVLEEPRRRKVDKHNISKVCSVIEVGANNMQFDVCSN
jgi:hypothetical protein